MIILPGCRYDLVLFGSWLAPKSVIVVISQLNSGVYRALGAF